MAIFKDIIMIKDRPHDRAVHVTVINSEDRNELAERAVRKTITVNGVTVKVGAFSR
jgi:hypothetical protein